MTAIAPVAPGRRILNGARVHAANPFTTLGLPWLILAAVFALTYAIWRIIAWAASSGGGLDDDAFRYAGGVSWIIFYMIAVAAQAMNQTFRFAVGLSQTRRDYFLGTAAYFGGMALIYGAGITVLAAVERATGGWGMGGAFFAPAFLYDAPLWVVMWSFVGLMLLMLFFGAVAGAIFLRWRATGLVTLLLALAAAIVGAVFLITWADAWGTVGELLGGTSVAALVAWTLPVTALLGGLAFLLLRRAAVRA
ncbi:ABC transporter permease [Demequina sp. SYSU T00039]|uniref:ABC transporter permease n=1 Tax=Demequina lignilytica TaxID=3051663 RepID=A0AAW7M483_9MICO|nr:MULTISPECIES: ABC transporter permease [unclassified Demequina]MDN4479285.1 ABC transporter permease [Demequina sp. SYSU T00039-1]MDN4488744.1 ABC transporter permease [Demequina sp. SYSU T00039]